MLARVVSLQESFLRFKQTRVAPFHGYFLRNLNYHVRVSTKFLSLVCVPYVYYIESRAQASPCRSMCGIGKFSFSDMHRITPELLAVCVPHICKRTHHITTIITHQIALRFYFVNCFFYQTKFQFKCFGTTLVYILLTFRRRSPLPALCFTFIAFLLTEVTSAEQVSEIL